MRSAILTSLAILTAAVTARAADQNPGPNPVEFKSGGEKVVGTLYLPAGYRVGQKLPAVVVAGPFLNTKEMVPANYAKALADRGLAALAFDFRYWGESGGKPRFYESASAKVADLRAAVAHLKGRPEIDPRRIGAVGVCFGAGHVIAAAVEDADIKAVATVAAWIHDPASVEATFSKDEVARRYAVGRAAMDKYKKTKEVDTVPAESATDKEAAMVKVDYYADKARGAGVESFANKMAVLSWPEWLDFDAVKLAPKLMTPLLMVHSDGSALPDNVKAFHAKAAGPKDLLWTQGNHTDFYDKPEYVGKAADAAAAHFRRAFGGPADATAGVKEFFAALEAMDVERFLKVWAEDGVQEMPFAPGDFPRKLAGKAAIRKQYEPLPKAFAGMTFPVRRLLPTADPRVVVAEYDGSIGLKAGGRYDNRYVGVFTFDAAGKLTHFAEYFDPFTLLRGFPGAALAGAPADEQITTLLKRLPAAADGRDWKGVRAVFAGEVDVDYTSVAGGKPGVVTADDLVRGWEEGLTKYKATKHNFSDFAVTLDGTDAKATFTGIATHERADGKRWTCGGDYTFRLKRTSDGWRVTAARFDMTWQQGDR